MSATIEKPPKVLHVLGSLNRGGVETWLMNIARTTSRDQMPMEICLLTRGSDPGAYAAEFKSLGGVIHHCPLGKNLLDFGKRFRRLLRDGKFDIVHSHVHHFSGYTLRLAAQEGIKGRIAHSHSDLRSVESGLLRRGYLRLMKKLIARYATAGLACSAEAALALYGESWQSDPRWEILYCGIDLRPFEQEIDRENVRSEFGFLPENRVWGHVGSFREVKNHRFLLEVFAKAFQSEPNLRLLLIGDGPLRAEMELRARELGIVDAVVFAGARDDVPRLMLGTIDLFILPSLYEGLPLVLLEAQAAGLPCVISDVVASEADVIEGRITRLSLESDVHHWAQICTAKGKQERLAGAVDEIRDGPFNVVQSAESLLNLYSCVPEVVH